MQKHKKLSAKILALMLTMAMIMTNILPTTAVFATDGGVVEQVTQNEEQQPQDITEILTPPEVPKCDCTEKCTAENQNNDCTICKDGYENCTFLLESKNETIKYNQILEKTKELLKWFDERMELVNKSGEIVKEEENVAGSSPASFEFELSDIDTVIDDSFGQNGGDMIIRGKDGYTLTDEDKQYFLDFYDEIITLADELVKELSQTEPDTDVYGELTNNESFVRMTMIYRTMGNYMPVNMAYILPEVGIHAGRTSIYANGTPLLITGTRDTSTTIYIDNDNSGTLTSGDTSLSEEGVVNAPENGKDLSEWCVFGGWSATAMTGTPKITMTGGNVNTVILGGNSNADITGYTNFKMTGGTIKSLMGGGYTSQLSGRSEITVTGGTIDYLTGGGQTQQVGGVAIKVGGSAVVKNIRGSGVYGIINGDISITIEGDALIDVINGSENANSSPTNPTVNGSVTINLNGGTVNNSVKCYNNAIVAYEKTINVSGNASANGVDISTTTSKKINITEPLTGRIKLVNPSAIAVNTIVATANTASNATADNFELQGLGLGKDGANIKIIKPTIVSNAGSNYVYGNGLGLLITGSSDISTTIYIDVNKNGTLDTGEKSLKSAGVVGAPEDGANLSTWLVYAGNQSTPLSGNTKVTMTGGKIDALIGGGSTGNIDGTSTINVSGGVVRYLGGGSYLGTIKGTTIDIGGTAKINFVYGGGQNLAVDGDVNITLSGNATVGAIHDTNGVAGADINGNVTVNLNGGNADNVNLVNGASITTGTKTVNVSGNPKISSGIDLSQITGNKVIINGELTGSAGGITLTGLTTIIEGTIVATSSPEGYADATKFIYSGKPLEVVGNDVKIITNSPYFEGNDLFAVNQPILLMKETDGTVNAYWDKNSDGIKDILDTLIAKPSVIGEPNSWNIYGGRKSIAMKAIEGSQITLLCGGFLSVNAGSKLGGDAVANVGVNRVVRVGTTEANSPIGFNSTQYKVTFDAQGGTYVTASFWQVQNKPLMPPPSLTAPIKAGNTFMGFYDAVIGGKQYYREDMKSAMETFKGNAPVTIYAKWSTSTGIFAGRYSHYQVFDCKRSPALPNANEAFHVFEFTPPFNDVVGSEYQMTKEAVAGKLFYFKATGKSDKPFILYMADDVDGTNEKAISRNGRIFAIGKEGLLFVSEGSDKGYFISLSQGFDYGDEITYRPTNVGPITEETANKHPDISSTPWDPNESYAVIFNSQGADTLAMPSQISVHKSPVPALVGTLPANPVKSGFRFDGWYTKIEGQGTAITINTQLTENITVYAKWTPSIEFLTVVLNGANLTPSAQFGTGKGVKNAIWTGVVLPKAGYKLPENIGITVGGTALTSGYEYSSATGEITISAGKMTDKVVISISALPISYTVKYNSNGAVGDPSPTEQIITFGIAANAANVGSMSTAPSNWTFKGWARTGDSKTAEYASGASIGLANPVTLTDGAIVTLYAVWDARDANVTLQNGSFEKPLVPSGSAWTNFRNGTPGLEWKTTAKDSMHEIVRPNNNVNATLSAFNTRMASEGYQFAELNANNVGALYQEVQTIPDSTLYWGADHKGRGGVDTMQVWIGTPTDIATALNQYVKGGNKVSAVNNALLNKIKQMECKTNKTNWKNYESEYTVPEGQRITTFAFVSVGSSIGSVSYGNLLDNIYFSFVKPPKRAGITVRTTIGGSVTISDGSIASTVLDVPNKEYAQSLEYGKVLHLGVQAKEGYSFNGGYINGTLYNNKEEFLRVSNNLHWTVDQNLPNDISILFSKKSTVIFNPQGGAYGKSEVKLAAGGGATGTETIAVPTKQDYKFKGWLIAGGNTILQAGDTISYVTSKTGAVKLEVKTAGQSLAYPITNGIVLIAQWDYDDSFLNGATIKLDYNDGTSTTITQLLNAAGAEYKLPKLPINQENRFMGWKYPMGELDTLYPADTMVRFDQNGSKPRVYIGSDINIALSEMVMIAQWEPKQITEVIINEKPKFEYEYGDKFDPAGLTMTVKHDNGTEKDVPYIGNEDKFVFAPTVNDLLTLTDNKVTITYTEGDTEYVSELTISVAKKTLTVAASGVTDKEYDGNTNALGSSIKLIGVIPGENVTVASGSVNFANKNVGNDKLVNITGIVLSGSDISNYYLSSPSLFDQSSTAKITAKSVTLTWHNSGTRAYDGASSGVYATANDIIAGDVCNVTVTNGSAKFAGNYTATATLSNNNYTISGIATQNYIINKAMLTATYEGATLVYKESIPASAKRVSVVGFVNGETAATATGYTAPTVSITERDGTYTVELTPTGGAASNYDFTYVAGSFNVINRDFNSVVVQNYSDDYDGKPHGLQIDNTDSSVTGAIMRYYETEAAANADTAGTGGTITAPTRTNVGNKTIYFKVIATGYNSPTSSGTITINKKKITPSVIASTVNSRTYNGGTDVSEQTTIKLEGLVGNETLNVTGERNCTDKNVGTGKTVQTGMLTVSDGANGGKSDNYELTKSTVTNTIPTLAITQKEMALTWSGHSDIVYSGTAANVVATILAADVEVGDICNVVVTGGNGVSAGSGYIAKAVLSNENYKATNITQSYGIDKKALTATFKSETIAYGDQPNLQIEVTGFVNEENANKATNYIAPTILTSPIPTTVGIHNIDLQGGYADNYSFALESGKLTITKADMSSGVTAVGYNGIYDGKSHGITVTAPSGAEITYGTTDNIFEAFDADKHEFINVGETIVNYKVTRENFADIVGSARVKIEKKPLTPSVISDLVADKIYDGNITTIGGTLKLSDVIGTDNVTASGVITFTDKNVGKNKLVNVTNITLADTSAGNYSLSAAGLQSVNTKAEITQLEATFTWSGDTGLSYDGSPKNVIALVNNIMNDDTCTTIVTGGDATLPGLHTATVTALSNPNYKLPTNPSRQYSIGNSAITGVQATPTVKLYDGLLSMGVTVTGTKESDKIFYSTDGVTWTTEVPKIGAAGNTDIHIKIQREHFDDIIIGPVTAMVKRSPTVQIDKPAFDVTDVKKIRVGGAVTQGDYTISNQKFEISKSGTGQWSELNAGSTVGNATTYLQQLDGLDHSTEYELRLTATDIQGNTATNTLRFMTQPKNPPTGAIEGIVNGNGNIIVTIEMGNTVVATLNGLKSGDIFSFKNLPDGEYNLVATDKDFQITQMVTVKDGATTTLGVVDIGVKQSAVKVIGLAPSVAVDGLNGLFDTPTFTGVPEAVSTVKDGGTVEMRLTSSEATNQSEIGEIKTSMGSNKLGVIVDLTVDMIITPLNSLSTITNLKSVDNLLTVAITLPSNAVNKNNYKAYRYHDGVEELTLIDADATPTEGSFRINGRYAYVYTTKFSTYAISYSTKGSSDNDIIINGGGGISSNTLTYESNGGSKITSTRHTPDTVVKLDKTPTWAGYTFEGWYADKALAEKITEIKMTDSKTVYAGWTATDKPPTLNTSDHFAYIMGRDDGLIHPNANITRAETGAIFFRLLTDEVRNANSTTSNNFKDVTTNDWFNTEVSTLASMGIISGKGKDIFAPNAQITRAEFAAIAARFASKSYEGKDLFTDISSSWARSEINKASSYGWVQGFNDGTFRPSEAITRAEAIAIINRVLGRLPESTDDLLNSMKVWKDNLDTNKWYYLPIQEATNSHSYEIKNDEVHEKWIAD